MPSTVELVLNETRVRGRQIEAEVAKQLRKLEKAPDGQMHYQTDYGVRGIQLNLLFDCINIREFTEIAGVVTQLMTEHRILRTKERKLEDEAAVEKKARSLAGTGVTQVLRGGFCDL